MSRSCKKPVCKLNNNVYFKKYFNRKIRRKKIFLHSNNYHKKLNCRYYICDFNTGELNKTTIEKLFGENEYKIRRK